MQATVQKLQNKLLQPEIKKSGTEQIKQKAKESIYSRIARARVTVEQQNRERLENTIKKVSHKNNQQFL